MDLLPNLIPACLPACCLSACLLTVGFATGSESLLIRFFRSANPDFLAGWINTVPRLRSSCLFSADLGTPDLGNLLALFSADLGGPASWHAAGRQCHLPDGACYSYRRETTWLRPRSEQREGLRQLQRWQQQPIEDIVASFRGQPLAARGALRTLRHTPERPFPGGRGNERTFPDPPVRQAGRPGYFRDFDGRQKRWNSAMSQHGHMGALIVKRDQRHF